MTHYLGAAAAAAAAAAAGGMLWDMANVGGWSMGDGGWGERTFGEGAHERAQVVRLLELALADLDDVREVLPDLVQQFLADAAFAVEQAVQRVLVVATLLFEPAECLLRTRSERQVYE